MSIEAPSAALGNIVDTGEVRAQVGDIVRGFAPGHDMSRIERTFTLLDDAFAGRLPGYQKLQTLYHNRMHTNEVVLCSARMVHGLHLAGMGLDGDHIDAALIGALMHDIGYLKRDDEVEGTGAQFTDTHVLRGVDFMRRQLADLPPPVVESVAKVILVTDHRKPADWVSFDDPQQRRAAYATATADLIGQMANREYLERLLLLYFEFEEAKMGDFADIHDLLEKTTFFYRMTSERLDGDLGGMASLLQRHFDAERQLDRNFYLESIARNLNYLETVVGEDRHRRFELLKRGGVVDQVRGLTGKD